MRPGTPAELLVAFLRLGMIAFGGPVAHLGYFREDIVQRRRWIDDAGYGDIVALCQILPGPASSQVAVSLGMVRAGLLGGLAAWLGFTAPSALAMIGFGAGVAFAGDLTHAPWLHGLKLVAVAVVAQAVWGMARSFCPDRSRATLAVAAALLSLAIPSSAGQIGAILMGAVAGLAFHREPPRVSDADLGFALPKPVAAGALVLFGLLLLLSLLPWSTWQAVQQVQAFYRSGSLVFGGGHVVLPLLQRAVVEPGWVGNDRFLAGYGAAQAVPGPLFTFAAYLGTVMAGPAGGWRGGLLCLVAIYLPSFLLLVGVLPFWNGLRNRRGMQAALRGINAAVVGLLLAAFYSPVWTSAVGAPVDFAVLLAAALALIAWKLPPWLVVVAGAAVMQVIGGFS